MLLLCLLLCLLLLDALERVAAAASAAVAESGRRRRRRRRRRSQGVKTPLLPQALGLEHEAVDVFDLLGCQKVGAGRQVLRYVRVRQESTQHETGVANLPHLRIVEEDFTVLLFGKRVKGLGVRGKGSGFRV